MSYRKFTYFLVTDLATARGPTARRSRTSKVSRPSSLPLTSVTDHHDGLRPNCRARLVRGSCRESPHEQHDRELTRRAPLQDLIKNGDAFSRLIAEFGSSSKGKKSEETLEELAEEVSEGKGDVEKKPRAEAGVGAKLMQDEERETGSIVRTSSINPVIGTVFLTEIGRAHV